MRYEDHKNDRWDYYSEVLRKIIKGIGAEIVGEASNFTDGLELAKKLANGENVQLPQGYSNVENNSGNTMILGLKSRFWFKLDNLDLMCSKFLSTDPKSTSNWIKVT